MASAGSYFGERGEAEESKEGWPPTARQNLRLDIDQPCADELGCLSQGPIKESDLNLNLPLACRDVQRVQVARLQQAEDRLCWHAIEAVRPSNHGRDV